MFDCVLNIWSLQEIMNSLPEITLHEYSREKKRFKEVSLSTYNKEWTSLTQRRKTPRSVLKSIPYYQTKSKENFIFFARNYLGVIKQDDFLCILKDILNLSSINTEKIRSFKPIYML